MNTNEMSSSALSGALRRGIESEGRGAASAAGDAPDTSEQAHERWPLLARLPRVGAGPRIHRARSEAQAGAVSARQNVDYRIDPAETRYRTSPTESQAGSPRETFRPTVTSQQSAATLAPRGHSSRAKLSAGSSSPAPLLPNSDLFASGDSSLHDAVAPLIRFLVIVALFTIAGTSVLLMYRAAPISEIDAIPTSTSVKNSNGKRYAPRSTKPRRGPLLSAELSSETEETAPSTRVSNKRADKSLSRSVSAELESAPAKLPQRSAAIDNPTNVPVVYPSTQWPAVTVPDAPIELPRVRTIEPPAAIAKLPGTIESPTFQAKHDDHKSSVH